MRLIVLLTLLFTISSCTDREESIGGLIGDYTHGDTPKVEINSVDIHTGTGYTNVNPIQVVINANAQAHLMRLGVDQVCGGLPFVTFEANNTVTLTENVNQTIYLQAKDTEDERTGCLNFSITHDNLNPQNPSFTNTSATQFYSTATDRSARTRWNSNDNGPAGILRYEVAVSTTPNTTGIIGAGFRNTTNRDYTYTGLSLSLYTDYYTLVRAVDRAGNESALRASPAWRVIYVPDQVTNVTLVESTFNSLEIDWDDVTNEMGTALSDYLVQYREDGTSTWITFNDGVGTVSETTITGLLPSTDYEIRIRAQNPNRTGAYSTTVTYSTQRVYRAFNVGGATQNQLVSFEDDNELTLNGNPLVTLDAQGIHAFASTPFSVIEGSKPFYASGALGGGSGSQRANTAWPNEDYPGRDFYFSHFEGTDMIVNVYALEDADITITNSGVIDITQTLPAGTGHVFNLNSQLNYHLNATGNVLVFAYSDGNGTEFLSARPILPASTDLIGTPYSSALINVSNDTNYLVNYTDGTTDTGSILFENPLTINNGVESARITSTEPIDITSYDGSSGQGASSFMPVSMLKTKYALNVDASLVMIVSTSANTVTRTEPDTSTSVINLNGLNPYNAMTGSVDAGTLFESATPFAIWYIPSSNTNGATGDETLLFGWDP